jgi:hypothetical protein
MSTLRDRLGALPTEGIPGMLAAAIVLAEMGEIPAKVTVSQWRAALAAQPAPAVMGEGAQNFKIALEVLERDWPPIPKKGPNDAWLDWAFEVDQMVRTGLAALRIAIREAEGRTAAAESREEPQFDFEAIGDYIDRVLAGQRELTPAEQKNLRAVYAKLGFVKIGAHQPGESQ